MVQERAREVYSGIKAPANLKESVRASIKARRSRMARQSAAWLSAAACLMVVFLVGRLEGHEPLILVDGATVSEEAVELDAYTEYAVNPAVAMARSMPGEEDAGGSGTRLRVPLEIRASGAAHVQVSVGTLLDAVETAFESDFVTELDISGKSVVYWVIDGAEGSLPVCKIVTETGEYSYVIEFDEKNAVYTIKQKTEAR